MVAGVLEVVVVITGTAGAPATAATVRAARAGPVVPRLVGAAAEVVHEKVVVAGKEVGVEAAAGAGALGQGAEAVGGGNNTYCQLTGLYHSHPRRVLLCGIFFLGVCGG
jgi:hypothetical protein